MTAPGPPQAAFDFVVIGAGTAGCVLAARLSQDRRFTVLLIEAGADLPPDGEPASVLDVFPSSWADRRFTWPGLTAMRNAGVSDSRTPVLQGYGTGGGSAIMGMFATRGGAADYDAWEAKGVEGWGWAGVLPFFRRCEHDADYPDAAEHGGAGPIMVRRLQPRQWSGFARMVAEQILANGARFIPDANGAKHECGLFPAPMNSRCERRSFTARDYLGQSVRRRPNLTILASAQARRIVFHGRRAAAVEVISAGRPRLLHAREIVLACGALQTPALLMRSGVGDGAALRRLGLDVVADLPGVGRRLLHHPTIRMATYLAPASRQASAVREATPWGWRYSSGLCEAPDGDMMIWPASRAAGNALGLKIGVLGVSVQRSFSAGSVWLDAPDAGPSVDLGLLADERDALRLGDGLTRIVGLMEQVSAQGACTPPFWPDEQLGRILNSPTAGARLGASLLSAALDLAPSAGCFAMRGHVLRRGMLSPEALRDLVERKVAAAPHFAGSCRIGPASEPHVVVDSRCRVHGVQGLRIADASVMPELIGANTHLPVIMIAEKAAEMLIGDQEERQGGPPGALRRSALA